MMVCGGGHTCHVALVEVSESVFVESVLSFSLRTVWAPECRLAGLLGRRLYLRAILAAPVLYFLLCYCFKKGSHVAQIGCRL